MSKKSPVGINNQKYLWLKLLKGTGFREESDVRFDIPIGYLKCKLQKALVTKLKL